MFSLSVGLERTGENGERYLAGKIVVGEFEESFRACLCYWDKNDYECRWRLAAEMLSAPFPRPAAFITNIHKPKGFGHMIWWPAWREGASIVLQNQHLRMSKLRPLFDPKTPFAHLPPRRCLDEDGPPSEWTVPLQDIREFHAALSRRKGK